METEVRLYDEADQAALIALAPRLTEGVPPWRDPSAVQAAVVGWVTESVRSAAEPDHVVLVADSAGEVVGFLSAQERRHWSGAVDAYVGELVVATEAEGRGIGRALVEAAARWAAERGIGRLSLETGAANQSARDFYQRLGFVVEDVRLTRQVGKVVGGPS